METEAELEIKQKKGKKGVNQIYPIHPISYPEENMKQFILEANQNCNKTPEKNVCESKILLS